ncbi:MAG: hypothetical protein BWY71_02411 [Planctomycetes bacterium ADurb.Bin412]|nr:MAG: hypothetical protein BWY71_02411 [Planctomycetes bacterium ADurb.Bin412]
MEIVGRCPNRQRGPEILVAGGILRNEKFRLTQGPLQVGEKMRDRLGIIPDVSAGAVTTTAAVPAAFPVPQKSILLPQHRRRLEDGQIGGDGLDDFRG